MVSVPPWAAMISCTIDSPSPAPCVAASPVWNGSTQSRAMLAEMPPPLSLIDTLALSRVATMYLAPRAWINALPTRLARALRTAASAPRDRWAAFRSHDFVAVPDPAWRKPARSGAGRRVRVRPSVQVRSRLRSWRAARSGEGAVGGRDCRGMGAALAYSRQYDGKLG